MADRSAGTAEQFLGTIEAGQPRPRVLVFAYACEPDRGSEPGAGWGLVTAISRFARCTVLVGTEHMDGIRRWQRSHDRNDLTFVEVPDRWITPPVQRHRLTRFLLYLVWLRRAGLVASALHRQNPFTAVWHATYSVYWLPSPAVSLDIPTIWGPVGGAVTTPAPLRPMLGWRGRVDELLDFVAVRTFDKWPATRRTWRKAAVRLVQNSETQNRLPESVRTDSVILNHAMLTVAPAVPVQPVGSHCLFVGPLESRKGAALAVLALAHTPADVTLKVVGDGPDRRRLERLAERLRVADRVIFSGWKSRADVMSYLATAAAVVFPGLREEGGIALAEAMLAGTPVIVLANGGAAVIARSSTDPMRVALIEPADPSTTAARMGAAMTGFIRTPPARRGSMLDTENASHELHEAFRRACAVTDR